MNLDNLKTKWNKEKDYYRNQEIGSGVHSFIRACLESEDLFSLRAGSIASKLESRQREFIIEQKAKENRKADFVVYIDSDIVIPLEAECYGNIEAGEKQLFEYQSDFDKNLGILTDGNKWRFYNNNSYREFTIKQIFEETEVFLEWWNDYIKPEFYYLSFFEPRGQPSLFDETIKLPVDSNRQNFFEDITKLIKSFKNKLNVEGYFQELDHREGLKRAVEITYAYIIQFILYKTLVDNSFGDFESEFVEITNAIHECLKSKQYGKVLAIIEGISSRLTQNIYRPFKTEQDFINHKVFDLIRKPKNEISEVSPWLDIFVFIKKYYFSSIQNEIFGYVYENYLKELYDEEKKGQYFTDPTIVRFMLNQVGYTKEFLNKQIQNGIGNISIIDPACGSGTFLYSAVDNILNSLYLYNQISSEKIEDIVTNNIFGLDIEEFPLYLAEMNVLMRMLPLIFGEKRNFPLGEKIKVFLTKDSIAEFIGSGIDNTEMDTSFRAGQMSLGLPEQEPEISSFMREANDIAEMKSSLKNLNGIPRRRYDFVVGNPPYISYNECSKQEILIFKLMQETN